MGDIFLNRIKKSLKDGKSGFSLVELLVCVAILGVIAVCVSMMLSAGTNSYIKVNKRVNVSYRTQIALTQMKEFFIDCDAICKDENNNIYIQNTDGNGDKIIYQFTYESDEKKVYLETFKTLLDEDGNFVSQGEKQPFANHISQFEIIINESRTTGSADTASVSITSTFDNVSNSRNQVFSMKNRPIYVNRSEQEGKTIVETFAEKIGG